LQYNLTSAAKRSCSCQCSALHGSASHRPMAGTDFCISCEDSSPG
jgi:hypothetical protein